MNPKLVTVPETWGEATRCLRVSGHVGIATAAAFRHAVFEVAAKPIPKALVLGLSRVQYMDSAGIAVLIEALRWSRQHQVRLLLLAPSAPVQRAVELAQVSDVFEVVDLEPDARLALVDVDPSVSPT